MKRLVTLLLCFGFSALHATTYYVKPTGSDGANGTSVGTAWATIGKANSMLVAGDVVYILAGTYAEKIDPVNSGSAGAEIAYIGYQNDHVMIRPTVVKGANEGDDFIARLTGNYIRLEKLDILPANYDTYRPAQWIWRSYMIQMTGNHCTLDRIRIPGYIAWADMGTVGLGSDLMRGVSNAGQYNTISDCYIRGVDMGVMSSWYWHEFEGRYAHYLRDTITCTTWSNIQIGATVNFDLGRFEQTMQRNLIEYCQLDSSYGEDNVQFETPSDPLNNAAGGWQRRTDYCNRGTIIRYCSMRNAGENAVDLKGALDIVIEYCIIEGSMNDDDGPYNGKGEGFRTGSAICLGIPTAWNKHAIIRGCVIYNNGGGVDLYEYDHLYNCTILNNRRFYDGNAYSPNQNAAQFGVYTMGGNYFVSINNIIGGQAGSTNAAFRGMIRWSSTMRIDWNVYYEDPAVQASVTFLERDGSQTWNSYSGLADWVAGISSFPLHGKDSASMETDPLLNSGVYPTTGTYDFSPQSGSPVIDAGTYLTYVVGTSSGTTLAVDDAWGFFGDDWQVPGALGDSIDVGGEHLRITAIDYNAGVLTLSRSISWSNGARVYLWPYHGSAPDIGAIESGEPPAADPPLSPVLSSPSDGATNVSLTPTFSWEASTGATYYVLRVCDDPEMGGIVYQKGSIYGTSQQADGLVPSATLYWAVRAVNSAGISAYSTVRSFTTEDGPPPGVTLSWPPNGSTGLPISPTLTWNASVGADSYTLQVSRVSTFSTLVFSVTGIHTTSRVVTGLNESTTYYWRVNSTGTGGTGDWSTVWGFATVISTPVSSMRTVLLRK